MKGLEKNNSKRTEPVETNMKMLEREGRRKDDSPGRRRNSTQKIVLLKSLRIKYKASVDCGSSSLNPQTRK